MGKMTIAAGNKKPNMLMSFTAVILAVIKQVMNMATTTMNHDEYLCWVDVFCS